MFGGLVIGNRRAQLRFQFGETILPIHVHHGVFALQKACLNGSPVAAEGGNAAYAGNYYSFQHKPPFTAITCRVM